MIPDYYFVFPGEAASKFLCLSSERDIIEIKIGVCVGEIR